MATLEFSTEDDNALRNDPKESAFRRLPGAESVSSIARSTEQKGNLA